MMPFRPIQYLGSKQRLAETISTVIDEVAPGTSRIGDLFAGSGVVSAFLGARRPVTAVDVQTYSQVLSSALLKGNAATFSTLVLHPALQRIKEISTHISEQLKPLLEFETEVLDRAAEGDPEPLIQLIEFGSLAVHKQRPPKGAPRRLAKLLHGAAEALGKMRFSKGDLTATRYFGGPYFSYCQAIELDAIYLSTKTRDTELTAPHALAVLLSTASEIVNTVGKQFAQPMKLKKADGRVPALLLQRALRDRSLDVLKVYKDWSGRWEAHAFEADRDHRIMREDVIHFVSQDRDCSAYYADPPYTIDHYSRFYHVLETLCLRDAPQLGEIKKRGKPSIMRGVYRVGRYQSPFCIPSEAPEAFNRLFFATAHRGAPLVLSYSPFDENEGDRPRLLTLEDLVAMAKREYQRVSVMEITEHSHRKLNAKAMNMGNRADAERLIICEAG